MNITYIRQRPFFKKVSKPKGKLKLTRLAETSQSQISTFPSKQLTLHEQLFTQSQFSPDKLENQPQIIPLKTYSNESDLDNFLKKRQSDNECSQMQPSYGNKKFYKNEHKSGRCRNPNYHHNQSHQSRHLSMNSYHSRPTIVPSNKQKMKFSKRYMDDLEKKLTILQKKIKDQFNRSQQTFQGFDQLEDELSKEKKNKQLEFKKQALIIKRRIQKQNQRNYQRINKKQNLLQSVADLIICNKKQQNQNQNLRNLIKKTIICQLYRRYPQGLPESPYSRSKMSSCERQENFLHRSTIQEQQFSLRPSNFETFESCFGDEQSKNLSKQKKVFSNRSTFAFMNQSIGKRESESILLDDSIFG